MRVSVFGLWGWVRTVWVCFSLFKKELRDRLTNVLVSGTMGMKNGGFAVAPYLCRYYCFKPPREVDGLLGVAPYLCRYYCFSIFNSVPNFRKVAPYLCRYYCFSVSTALMRSKASYTLPTQVSPNKKAKLNTSFAFCFLCFCHQNFFFLHSHKLKRRNSTLTPMTAG